MNKNEQELQKPNISLEREDTHIRMSKYVFDDIPFTGRNVWCFSDFKSFACWKVNFLQSKDPTNNLELLANLFMLHNLHKTPSNSTSDFQNIFRANCQFAYYKAHFLLYEEYFEDWATDMKTSKYPSNRKKYIENVYPIHVDRVYQDNLMEFRISLHTDFWFPWCKGLKLKEPAQSKEEMYDNRQGAWRHTPRLNRCLTEIKQLMVESGGAWKVGTENVHEDYQYMVTDTGIKLGMPDDLKYLKK